MKPIQAAIIVFIICALITLSLAWLSGYNFDHRGESIALTFYVFLIVSGLASGITYDISKKDPK